VEWSDGARITILATATVGRPPRRVADKASEAASPTLYWQSATDCASRIVQRTPDAVAPVVRATPAERKPSEGTLYTKAPWIVHRRIVIFVKWTWILAWGMWPTLRSERGEIIDPINGIKVVLRSNAKLKGIRE
jgi:hypothetical protein